MGDKVVSILVACGSGVATSMHVGSVIKDYMKEQHLRVEIDGTSINNLPFRLIGKDLIVSSAQVPFETGLPVFNGIPILTGIGQQELLEKIADKVRELSEAKE